MGATTPPLLLQFLGSGSEGDALAVLLNQLHRSESSSADESDLSIRTVARCRTCITLVDPVKGEATEIIEPSGKSSFPAHLRALYNFVSFLSTRVTILPLLFYLWTKSILDAIIYFSVIKLNSTHIKLISIYLFQALFYPVNFSLCCYLLRKSLQMTRLGGLPLWDPCHLDAL